MSDVDNVIWFVIAANVGALLLWMFCTWFQSRMWSRIRYKHDRE